MKHDILIRTDAGPVVITPTGPETFGLRGQPKAIDLLKQALPALEVADNPTGMLGDCLTRLVYLGAKKPAEPTRRIIPATQEEMVERTLLENPVVLFQTREVEEGGDGDAVAWNTERVFIDDDMARDWLDRMPYRFAPNNEDLRWRFYAVPCMGDLAVAVKNHRDLCNA